MMGLGVEVGVWRIEQEQESLVVRLYKEGRLVYNEADTKLYTMSELEEKIFELSREVSNGIRFENMG